MAFEMNGVQVYNDSCASGWASSAARCLPDRRLCVHARLRNRLRLPHLAAKHSLGLPFRGHHPARLHRPAHGPQDLLPHDACHEHGLSPPRRGGQVLESFTWPFSRASSRTAGEAIPTGARLSSAAVESGQVDAKHRIDTTHDGSPRGAGKTLKTSVKYSRQRP